MLGTHNEHCLVGVAPLLACLPGANRWAGSVNAQLLAAVTHTRCFYYVGPVVGHTYSNVCYLKHHAE